MNQIKKSISRLFPELAGAYHSFRISREMSRHTVKETPLGFRFLGNNLMRDGSFEPNETKLMKDFADDIDVFIDIGANIGYFVCLMKSLGKHVIAIEPLRKNLDYLYANLAENHWEDVEVLPLGVSSQPSIMKIFGGGTGASLIPHWAGASEVLNSTIPVNTLDNLIGERYQSKSILIKIDVEGAELDVLRGALNVLSRQRPPIWLIEICLTENHPDGCNPHFVGVFKLMLDKGYKAYSVEAGMREVTELDVKKWFASKQRDFGYVSYFFQKGE